MPRAGPVVCPGGPPTRLEDPVVRRAAELGMRVVSVLRRTAEGTGSAVINDCAGGMRALLGDAIFRQCRDTAESVSAHPGALPELVADVSGHVEANVLSSG